MFRVQTLSETKQSSTFDITISENENSSEKSFSTSFKLYESTILRVNSLLNGQSSSGMGNWTQSLSEWQVAQLAATKSDDGIKCLFNMWFGLEEIYTKNELYCSTVWDNIYCWPATLAGTTIKRACMKVLRKIPELSGRQIDGYAFRECLSNGTWSRGIRTNYTECAKALLDSPKNLDEEHNMTVFTRYMVFVGSIASLLFLGITLAVLCSFRSVWNERMKIHVNLMLSLVLRSVVFVVVSEPLIFKRESSYRDNSILCKTVLMAHLYATLASTSWMLVQGIYLNGKLTTNVFGFRRREFLKFYVIGWGLPAILLGIYLIAMIATEHSGNCWQGYAGMTEIWILLLPMEAEMLLTGLLLCNILRVVVTRGRNANEESELSQIKSIAKSTLVLFPILGLNNLLFLYNPGGEYETLFVSLNVFFCSTQGILVAIVYFYNCTEVHTAIKRSYSRYSVGRRSAHNNSQGNRNYFAVVVYRVAEVDQPNDNNPVVEVDNEDSGEE